MPSPTVITPRTITPPSEQKNQDYPRYETKREPLQLNENILFLKMFSNLDLTCIDLTYFDNHMKDLKGEKINSTLAR